MQSRKIDRPKIVSTNVASDLRSSSSNESRFLAG